MDGQIVKKINDSLKDFDLSAVAIVENDVNGNNWINFTLVNTLLKHIEAVFAIVERDNGNYSLQYFIPVSTFPSEMARTINTIEGLFKK